MSSPNAMNRMKQGFKCMPLTVASPPWAWSLHRETRSLLKPSAAEMFKSRSFPLHPRHSRPMHPSTRKQFVPGSAILLALATVYAAGPSACFAQAKAKVMFWPYDFTTPTAAHLSTLTTGKEPSELRRGTDRVVADYLCGEYTGPSDFEGGYALDIFPDGTAMLSVTSDVGPPLLDDEGTWIARPNGVSISWKSLNFWRAKDSFLKTRGDCRELGLYLYFSEHRVRDVILISHEFESGPEIKSYFVRRKEFVDWQGIRDDLRQAAKPADTQPSRPRQ
jgi:hypothetical protein